MSVIVKGMKMPARCELCPFSGISGKSCELISCTFTGKHRYFNDGQYLEDCPLIEVPTPHGDLIDRDTLLAYENQHYEYHSDSFYVETRTIELAPTIIGAEAET